jgi:hypothetical protein
VDRKQRERRGQRKDIHKDPPLITHFLQLDPTSL